MNNKSPMAWLVNLVMVIALVWGGLNLYYLLHHQALLQNDVARLLKSQEILRKLAKEKPRVAAISPIQKATWVSVQQKAKNAVVRLIVTTARFNWFEPYKTPVQGSVAGSGFFINDKGLFISNFHVIDEASSIHVQIPSFGQERFDAKIIGVSPERDIALLQLTNESLERVKQQLGSVPFLTFGDSDTVLRGQEILALGYPLGTQTFKSTQGIISGRERFAGGLYGYMQITAALNPGNSGGPAVNTEGNVVGINTAGIPGAQNVGYIIPINEVRSAIKDLYEVKLLRKPFLGGIFTPTSPDTVEYLGNPAGGGYYVARVFSNSLLKKAGFIEGDMIYELNGFRVDRFGEVEVHWSEDRVSMLELLNRFKVGDELHFMLYRNGDRKDIKFTLKLAEIPPVRQMYSQFEKIDYETFGGMVFMELTMNHVAFLLERAPHLIRYRKPERQYQPALIVTHVIANSQAHKSRMISPGIIIREVNGQKVSTLTELRAAVKQGAKNRFVTLRYRDRSVDNMFVALSLEKILKDEDELILRYLPKKSKLAKEMQLLAA